jgi:hypothetical protein
MVGLRDKQGGVQLCMMPGVECTRFSLGWGGAVSHSFLKMQSDTEQRETCNQGSIDNTVFCHSIRQLDNGTAWQELWHDAAEVPVL